MTDDTTASEQTPTEAPETPPEAAEETESAPGDREAAKLRKRAQAAETERDELRGQVETYRRSEVERLAVGPGKLIDPADVWRAVDLPSVLGEDGGVNPELVAAAVAALVTEKPHLAAQEIGLDLGFTGMPSSSGKASWTDVLKAGVTAG